MINNSALLELKGIPNQQAKYNNNQCLISIWHRAPLQLTIIFLKAKFSSF